MKEVIIFVIAMFVFLALFIRRIYNYSSFCGMAIYCIIAIILFTIFGGYWGFTVSFIFSILVALTTDDDGEFKKKEDETNATSPSYFDVDKIMNSGIVKNEIHNTVVRLTKSHVDGIGYVPATPIPPAFCMPKKRFSSSGKEIPSSFDINKISYETVIRIESLGTPVPAYYVYFESCKGISKVRVSGKNITPYHVGKITGIFYDGSHLVKNRQYIFQVLHPIGSTIYGYVKDQGDTTIICDFPEESPIDGSDCGMTAFWKCAADSTFPYYCQKGNIIKAVVSDYIVSTWGKHKIHTDEVILKLSEIEVTYTKSLI